MKKLFVLILTLTSLHLFADEPTEVKSKIDAVTIFLNGAEIINTAQIKLTGGQKEYVFTGLSPKMISGSVNVTATNDVSIVSIVERINYLDETAPNAKIQSLKDSVDILNTKISMNNNEQAAYNEEKNMLIRNESLGGANTGVTTEEIMKAADFYRTRLIDINNKVFDLQQKQGKIYEKINRINNQLTEMNAKFNQPKSEVIVTLNSDAPKTTDIKLRFLVTSAGWAPTYDLAVQDISNPISLKYRANVMNNTDMDWNNVKVKLSTADPLQSITKPKLETWVLNYNQNDYYGFQYNQQNGAFENSLNIAPSVAYDEEKPTSPNQQVVKDAQLYQAIEVSLVTTTFEIKTPYTIPSDGKPYMIDIKTEELPAIYSYYSAPKIDESAFLLGRVVGWEELNLVEGDANIYFGDTYLGKSHIYTQNIEDTLDLSLGRDDKVMITRTKLKEFSSKQFLGSTQKETFTYEISVKNNRDKDVTVQVQDQVPISQEEDIVVEVGDVSGAQEDANTGILTWNLKLKAGETQKLKLSFSIKHPKNKEVKVEQSRVMYSPKF